MITDTDVWSDYIHRENRRAPTWERENVLLWLGNCFDYLPMIKDHSIDLILADLPYGLTSCGWDSVLPLDQLWVEYKRVIKENGAVVLTSAQPYTWKLCSSNPEWFKDEIIWEKPNGTNPTLVKLRPFRVHENILIFYAKQPTYNPQMSFGHSNYSGFEDLTKTIGVVYTEGQKQKLV